VRQLQQTDLRVGATLVVAMLRHVLRLGLVTIVACAEPDSPTDATTEATSTTSSTPVSYAACDDPEQGCGDADCRRVDEAWSICMPSCAEDADCPIGAGGNAQVVCDQGRCILECVPQVLTCPSGTTCVGIATPQCMWPAQ